MPRTDRTFQIGRLAELKEKASRLRIKIDAYVKQLVVHFDPLDLDMEYTEKIDPWKLETYVREIKRNVEELQRVRVDIKQLQAELGQNEK